MKDLLKYILISVSIIVLGFGLLFGIDALCAANDFRKDVKLYNNGICSRCGGTYEYSQAVGHKYETNYIYICNSCGNLIEIGYYYQENN